MKSSVDIRKEFIEYFRQKGHKEVMSSPVIPHDDPTLLFTNAGMNQFKDIFLGTGKRDYNRAVNTQKCIRAGGKHNDLDEVGKDSYHHSFFEMLGNWSFGDYYKKKAVEWAWDLLTGVWKLDKSKLYATVFETDDESGDIWKEVTDIDHSKISKHGEKDNFWSMGETGPCGPCSEIHYDRGPEFCSQKSDSDHKCEVNGDCGRIIEIWNLVFIQYDRKDNGELTELPAKHVDTGMGFERICMVLQGTDSNYHIDLFRDIIASVEKITGIPYTPDEKGTPHRVIADHARALLFAISDGGLPSNEGRGYVLRRILRRASRYGSKLGISEPFIYKIAGTVAAIMGEQFPETRKYLKHAQSIIKAEETSFLKTLSNGIDLFNEHVNTMKKGEKIIDGGTVFRLYDTFGFPVDLTEQMAEENGMRIDKDGFEKEMQKQKDQSKASKKFTDTSETDWTVINEGASTEFTGYDDLSDSSKIIKYRTDKKKLYIVPDKSSFYAESGGQVADKGYIIINDVKHYVSDVQKDGEFFVISVKRPETVELDAGTVIEMHPDENFRNDCRIHHSATHLLQSAIREVYGDHIAQSGSYVDNTKLHFDYSNYEKMSSENIRRIEEIVNRHVGNNYEIITDIKPIEEAKKMNVTALFGEKYGDIVRIVNMGDVSAELCGGTHAYRTGDIGYFRIVSESSISAGIRRIEAVCGSTAVKYAADQRDIINSLVEMHAVKEKEIVSRVQKIVEDKRDAEKTIAEMNEKMAMAQMHDLLNQKKNINGIDIISSVVNVNDAKILKNMAENLRAQVNKTIILLGAEVNGKASIVCAVTDDLKDMIKAGQIVGQIAKMLGGGGGGAPHLATAGAKNADGLKDAINSINEMI